MTTSVHIMIAQEFHGTYETVRALIYYGIIDWDGSMVHGLMLRHSPACRVWDLSHIMRFMLRT
jgi:hypothetical protein